VTTETYQEINARHRREFESLPIQWAFSDKQFKEGMAALGLTVDDVDQVYKVPGGGFMKRSEFHLLPEMMSRHHDEMQAAIDQDTTGTGFIFDMFDYELSNHEFIITHDTGPALDYLGLSEKDIEKNPALENGLRLALQEQRKKRSA
jgi:hypothetical protein